MKKHAKLYNRLFEALHEDDKFVLCLDKTHQKIVALMAQAIEEGDQAGMNYGGLAKVALTALQNAADDEALSNETCGTAPDWQLTATALREELAVVKKHRDLEAWMHAACLSIAEGAPGWEEALVGASEAMRQVQALRRAYEKIRAAIRLTCPALVGETELETLTRTLRELREALG